MVSITFHDGLERLIDGDKIVMQDGCLHVKSNGTVVAIIDGNSYRIASLAREEADNV